MSRADSGDHCYCGRTFSADELDSIRSLIASDREKKRAELSRLVCDMLGWKRPDGGRKDMSCRVAMLRMHRDGLIELPPPQGTNGNGRRRPKLTSASEPQETVQQSAGSLGELEFRQVEGRKDSSFWNELIERHHYLGYEPLGGAQIRYFVFGRSHLLAALGFGASAWKVAARDLFIGWTAEHRSRHLHLVVNNARFLILPWIRSPNLASRLLSAAAKRLGEDWESRYGYRPFLLETFVDRDRFEGTCYRAANWIRVGETQGRGKSDRYWVVAALWLPLPWNRDRGLAIPILFRLYRSKKRCPKAKYRKRTDMARELVNIVATWMPEDHQLRVVADAEYACKTLVRRLPATIAFTGPMSMDAALYDQPVPQQGRGRPRRKGKRLPSPRKLAASRSVRWKTLTMPIYGREVVAQVKTQLCLWYTVAGTRLLRMIVTRDPSGRINDRAYFTTDTDGTEGDVMVQFARRWEIEVAFRNTKQGMGLEHPQNGWWRRPNGSPRPKKRPGPNPKGSVGEKAVNHTLAVAFAAYAIVVLWYFQHGNPKDDVARVRREAPWYLHKRAPSFNDMLAAARREIWVVRFSRHPALRWGREKIEMLLPHWLLAS